ncbi:AmmeMemoRadiSam system protein B [Halarcobacter ebronensis]|uniref:MEMO1 family protein CRV08_14910 n=1 Tax=Halarcobacter ebronensis TaxID=1462615 RepID=A0A4Q0Y5X1_9BACT|nr:AmmeMemoRadiSam system protein B [Halarcobacter ebronensis]RXJ65567.1 AmmeMemoRadiSam system protein B [Halarcobacter ebronensis]
MGQREMAVAGSFYPKSKEEIDKFIEYFNQSFFLKENNDKLKVRAIIVPHAGYIYSGFTANLAYNLSSKNSYKRVVVIGPSHKIYIEGASIALYESFKTPLGDLKIDLEYSSKLKDTYSFVTFIPEAHKEHSTETQAPFIKNYFEDIKIVELVYGKLDFNELSKLVDELLEDKDNLIVISTDLSHFYKLEEAKKLDNICLNAILKRDLELFENGCEACGKVGVKALVKSSIKKDLEFELLHYCTSYDRTKDDTSVVGYSSFLLKEKV